MPAACGEGRSYCSSWEGFPHLKFCPTFVQTQHGISLIVYTAHRPNIAQSHIVPHMDHGWEIFFWEESTLGMTLLMEVNREPSVWMANKNLFTNQDTLVHCSCSNSFFKQSWAWGLDNKWTSGGARLKATRRPGSWSLYSRTHQYLLQYFSPSIQQSLLRDTAAEPLPRAPQGQCCHWLLSSKGISWNMTTPTLTTHGKHKIVHFRRSGRGN